MCLNDIYFNIKDVVNNALAYKDEPKKIIRINDQHLLLYLKKIWRVHAVICCLESYIICAQTHNE